MGSTDFTLLNATDTLHTDVTSLNTTDHQHIDSQHTDQQHSDVQMSMVAIGAFLLSALIIFGNSTTLLAMKRTRSLQTKANAFVASLAGADLMIGFLLIPYGFWLIPHNHSGVFQTISFCVLMLSSGSSAIVISILSLLLVAVDRLVFISFPFFYQRVVTNVVIGASIAIPWTVGLCFGNIQWIIYAPKTNPPCCIANKILPSVYFKYASGLFFFTPCVAIFIIYINIAMIARKQRRAIKKFNTVQPFSVYTVQTFSVNLNDKTPKISRTNWKATKMMMTVFGSFVICWTPRFILHTLPDDVFDTRVPIMFYNLCLILGLLNSGLNFLVYPLHNIEFRRAFRRIFCLTPKLDLNRVHPSHNSFVISEVSTCGHHSFGQGREIKQSY